MIHRYHDNVQEVIEVANELNNGNFGPHADLNKLLDDVLILAKEHNNGRIFWFFWFDHDVSDCMIGRFGTDDSQEEVISVFKNYVEDRAKELSRDYIGREYPPIELNVDNIRGWRSF